jgi:predicted ATP-grasp superfamily ATP-dependent carboligase
MSERSVSAVVVGGGVNALGVVRSLGVGGVPVVVVAAGTQGPAMASKHARKRVVSPVEGPGLIGTLVELARDAAEKPVLFLTEEKTVHTVSERRGELASRYRIRLPAHDTLMALMHKQGFQELAERCGAPVPRCVNLRSRADLPALGALKFPCVLKPSDKNYQYGARFKKGYVVQSPAEVERLYGEIEEVQADMVVQEWIDGADSDVYFCLQYVGGDGAPVASFSGRKIRSWPPKIGGTASCTASWEDDEALTRATREFFARVGFTGMGSMEYKRDRRDGRFYMIEPTAARTDFQQEVATIHGINIPLAAWCHETGASPERALRPNRPARIVWRETETDRQSIEAQGKSTEFSALPVCGAYWRWSDPGPWFYWMRKWVAERARGLRRRILALLATETRDIESKDTSTTESRGHTPN